MNEDDRPGRRQSSESRQDPDPATSTGQALVLGGGVSGIAWITGLLTGLADAGKDVTDVELIVGTSAGATVAAQLGSGLSLQELYARQVQPELQSAEIMVDVDLESFAAQIASVLRRARTIPEMRRAVGRFALDAATVPEPQRRAVIESRLPSQDWPARNLKLVAVDADSSESRVFDSASGVDSSTLSPPATRSRAYGRPRRSTGVATSTAALAPARTPTALPAHREYS